MKHFMNNGKEYLRQYRSNQGRSPRQTEGNYKIMYWSLIGLLGMIVIFWLCGVFGLEL